MVNIISSLQNISPRKRVELALQKKFLNKVPFTVKMIYWQFVSKRKKL